MIGDWLSKIRKAVDSFIEKTIPKKQSKMEFDDLLIRKEKSGGFFDNIKKSIDSFFSRIFPDKDSEKIEFIEIEQIDEDPRASRKKSILDPVNKSINSIFRKVDSFFSKKYRDDKGSLIQEFPSGAVAITMNIDGREVFFFFSNSFVKTKSYLSNPADPILKSSFKQASFDSDIEVLARVPDPSGGRVRYYNESFFYKLNIKYDRLVKYSYQQLAAYYYNYVKSLLVRNRKSSKEESVISILEVRVDL